MRTLITEAAQTLLTANSTYSSLTKIKCAGYKTVRGMIYSDKASALNGFTVTQSADGSTYDHVTDKDTVAAATTFTFDYKLYGEFINISYKNGAAGQGTFRMAIYLVD